VVAALLTAGADPDKQVPSYALRIASCLQRQREGGRERERESLDKQVA
jgi:hypothetical protein